MKLYRPRQVGPVLGLTAACLTAAALLVVATADLWLADRAIDLPRVGTLAALCLCASVALVWFLRATHEGRRRRAFFTALGLLVAFVTAIQAAQHLRPFPPQGAPVAMLGILGAAVLGRGSGLALAAAGAFVVACLGQPDAALALVLFAQGAGGAL